VSFSVRAFMCVYNEADILPWTLQHLVGQGVEIHVIDNWSTDGSDEIAQRFPLAGFEKFPSEGPSQFYLWGRLLGQVETLAAESPATWCIHHDADEIRRSPRESETLAQALERVDRIGYNAIDHQVLQFYPTDDNYSGDPERHFTSYTLEHLDARLPHIKAWKNRFRRVDLASSGGHQARFPGRIVSPVPLVLKHYPIRTSKQGARKVLEERMARYDPAERARNWHRQYDELAVSRRWIGKR
jgi:glycosyltransferase involved in cell wall biosynthesis